MLLELFGNLRDDGVYPKEVFKNKIKIQINKIKINLREKIINLFRDYSFLLAEVKYKAKNGQKNIML